ncbi:MAG: lipoate--protein ligase family protein [Candidatus Longimicrobiales bacterium M2_2A_002]
MSPDRTPGGNESSPSAGPRPWRLIVAGGGGRPPMEPARGAENMAIDSALLDAVKDGAAPVLRLYRWSPATLSFGRNQPSRGRYDRDAATARGIDFVRRPTGGQAVLHDDELTYAVVAPVSVIGRPRAAYRRINEALVDGLGRLGVRATVAAGGLGGGAGGRGAEVAAEVGSGAGRPPAGGPDWDAACFRRPERGEVVVEGAKLVGSAQRMEDRTILQHGSILVGGSQAAAEELLVVGQRAGASATAGVRPGSGAHDDPGWTTLERELGARPSPEVLGEAVRAGFESALGLDLEEGRLSPDEQESAASLERHYGSEAWTWRR